VTVGRARQRPRDRLGSASPASTRKAASTRKLHRSTRKRVQSGPQAGVVSNLNPGPRLGKRPWAAEVNQLGPLPSYAFSAVIYVRQHGPHHGILAGGCGPASLSAAARPRPAEMLTEPAGAIRLILIDQQWDRGSRYRDSTSLGGRRDRAALTVGDCSLFSKCTTHRRRQQLKS
jgi:hypothetical protein